MPPKHNPEPLFQNNPNEMLPKSAEQDLPSPLVLVLIENKCYKFVRVTVDEEPQFLRPLSSSNRPISESLTESSRHSQSILKYSLCDQYPLSKLYYHPSAFGHYIYLLVVKSLCYQS